MQAQKLGRTGLVALPYVGSSRTTVQTCVPCFGRRVYTHGDTRKTRCRTRSGVPCAIGRSLLIVYFVYSSEEGRKGCVLSHIRPFATPPGSSVHGISQARMLEWVAIPFSRGLSQPRDRTLVP